MRENLKMLRSILKVKPSNELIVVFFSMNKRAIEPCRTKSDLKFELPVHLRPHLNHCSLSNQICQIHQLSHLSTTKSFGSHLWWAIVMTVDSFSSSRTTFQIFCSVSGSTWAVGSSETTILLCCSSTRAKQINCCSPTLTLAPCSRSSWSSLALSASTKSFSCTSSKACHNSASWN